MSEATAVDEQVDAAVRPGVAFGLGHRIAKTHGVASRYCNDDVKELFGRGLWMTEGKVTGARFAIEHSRDVRHRLNAGSPISLGGEQFGGNIRYPLTKRRCFRKQWSATIAKLDENDFDPG